MAYRIDYDGPPLFRRKTGISWRMPLMTAGFFFLFLFCIKAAWPNGSEKLLALLTPPGSAMESVAALEAFISNLKDGQPFYESLTAFCQQIVAYAQLTPA